MAKRVEGGPDGVRPLAVGEVLHRLVARAVDLANAFNEVDRVAMFDELRLHFLELLPFFRCFYGEPSRLLLRRDSGDWELLQSSTGSRHGDPLAGFLFALAYHCPLSATCAAFPDVQLPSYADDTHIVNAPVRAADTFAHLQGGLATLSLRVKLAKCAVFSTAELPPAFPSPPSSGAPPTAS
ncbi:hypothetical protein with reverse transcriptase-like domain [Klebsormidium nitens]|uniref:Reverse transcriptase domain-containing protein n=1 Tax=Klebsormidium nitens TaxID=105231 RepID=A0A1Y1ISA8_KLENI|nr:hypothetical protein with reverse transcriptase-like domain [Klebsormidium nitens]|eukprot:GAQ92922.1 hypothetical protein with reverse transcriptase-like domain [Klebsormidium nitens]